ncbi:MAG: hypothetical protein JWO67_6960 [Streptosporangiaceae bacterium]|nr:hypothetical protein [Streptosporangiaceae bacterium]
MAEGLAQAAPAQQRPMSLAGFDPIRALLTQLVDAINVNTAATIAAAGADPPTFDPLPRPETELDRARARVRSQARQALTDLFLGRTPAT